MDKLGRKWTTPAKAATVALLVAGGSAVALPAYSGAAPLTSGVLVANGKNLSGNPYFPLKVGASWTYKLVGGKETGETFKSSVLSGTKTPAGEEVDVQLSVKGTVINADYVIEKSGAIKVQTSMGGGGSSSAGFSAGGSYFVPSAKQVTTCAPCNFTGAFTVTIGGQALAGQQTETATSEGAHQVKVAAGTYTAQELHLSIGISASSSAITMKSTSSQDIYLVKNVGLVDSAAGTSKVSVMGEDITTATPAEELVNYTS
jgi:hypothetical protein